MKKAKRKAHKGPKRHSKRKAASGVGVEKCIKAITKSKLSKLPTKKLESASKKLRDRFTDTEVLLSGR
jgi:hypothetical protein